MKRNNSNKTHRVCLRLTPEKFAEIEKQWKDTTCQKLSDYLPHNLFEKPVVINIPKPTDDDLMAEMSKRRAVLPHPKQLQSGGNTSAFGCPGKFRMRPLPTTWMK